MGSGKSKGSSRSQGKSGRGRSGRPCRRIRWATAGLPRWVLGRTSRRYLPSDPAAFSGRLDVASVSPLALALVFLTFLLSSFFSSLPPCWAQLCILPSSPSQPLCNCM